ncbi:MAG: hypothetical protein ACRYFK_16895 [Janthinobacterium lividum]
MRHHHHRRHWQPYVADANQKRVLKVTPAGESSTLGRSPNLIWVDAMWLHHAGSL